MSRSCHSATFSSAACALPRSTRARPEICSLLIGLRLCGIAERALLAGPERLLSLAHLRALQVADLGREPLEAGARERDRPEQLRVAVARRRPAWRLLAREPQAVEHAPLELGAGRGVGADRAGDRADRDLLEGAVAAARVAVRLEREARELEPKVVGSACTPCVRPTQSVSTCSRARRGERPHERVSARDDHLARRAQLQRERRVEHVRGGQPEVDPAPRLAGATRPARRRTPRRRDR